ncbi:MAG: radical SAM protein, partial [Spirochaetia bacterium]|nr:radical SAM protein [Spirochaetia bacterium]
RGRMEPLTFAALKALTADEHETVLYDDRFETIPYDDPTDLVAINIEIYTARRTYEIAENFRKRNVPVVIGGYHATMIPEECGRYADSVVTGDAEGVWKEILKDASKGNLKKRYSGSVSDPALLGNYKLDWSIFSGKSYLPVRLTQFGRGCVNLCEYCATGSVYKRKFLTRPVDTVIRELEEDGSRNVFFVDDNIVSDKEAAKKLFRALIPLKINWFSQADLSFAHDPELLDLIMESGCVGMVVGFESLNKKNLSQMNKNCNLRFNGYDNLVETIRKAGLFLWAAFLLGYDSDTPETVQETLDWALSKKFAFSAFNILMPYPGTNLYSRMKSEDRLRFNGNWWLHDDYRFGQTGIQSRLCSPADLEEACYRARLTHSSVYQIFRRSLDRKTHMKDLKSLVTYFMYNPIFRDELKKKHGMMLGYRGEERF